MPDGSSKETHRLLEVADLNRTFTDRRGTIFRPVEHLTKAVDGISFTVESDSTFSIIGESGCGKSTTLRMVLGLDRPTSGTIRFDGADILEMAPETQRTFRRSVQAVFQDPTSSLSPRQTIGAIISEPIRANERVTKSDLAARVSDLLSTVGLSTSLAGSYPHELSGGMRQRVAIARAISINPKLIILDEPVSALDVSVQSQVMNLLKRLQREMGTSYLLVAHDLASVRFLSDHVATMFAGRFVETGPSENVFSDPLHPFTRELVDAASPTALTSDLHEPAEAQPDGDAAGTGCAFRLRCPHAFAPCHAAAPDLRIAAPGHFVACHLHDPAAAAGSAEIGSSG